MASLRLHRTVFGICALMLLVLPGMAAAQSSSTFIVPFDRTMAPGVDANGNPTGAFNNPCTLEWVDVTGSSSVTINQTAKDSKGEFKTPVAVTSTGSGAGWVPPPGAPDPPTATDYAIATFTLSLRPTELLVFGHPQGGTPFMECAQTVGIDLPLKLLVWEDAQGRAWLGYNDPGYLAQRHGVADCPAVDGLRKALTTLARAVVSREGDGAR